MAEKIKARYITEIMGRPQKHVEEAINLLVTKMSSEKGITINEKKYHKAKAIKEAENLYTSFAEIEAEFEDLNTFFGIIFTYMPSNIEVYEPNNLKMGNHDLNAASNYIISKLHHYDAIAKNLVAERDILMQQIEKLKEKGIKMDVLDTFREKAEKNLNIKEGKEKKDKPKKGKKTKKKK